MKKNHIAIHFAPQSRFTAVVAQHASEKKKQASKQVDRRNPPVSDWPLALARALTCAHAHQSCPGQTFHTLLPECASEHTHTHTHSIGTPIQQKNKNKTGLTLILIHTTYAFCDGQTTCTYAYGVGLPSNSIMLSRSTLCITHSGQKGATT